MVSNKEKTSIKLIAQNKKASYDYFIEETFQSGIELLGTEVKSLRALKCNLKDSYIIIKNLEAFIFNMHISPYEQGNIFNKDPLRTRKLLLHKKQIKNIQIKTTKEGYTAVPLKIYFCRSYVKIDIAIVKGKKNYDKRETIAKKEHMREIAKQLKFKNQ